LPSAGVEDFVVTRAVVEQPEAELSRLSGNSEYAEEVLIREQIRGFCRGFRERHGIEIRLSDEAVARLVAMARSRSMTGNALCMDLFADYAYGLQLVTKNRAGNSFALPLEAVEDPQGFLSRLVRSSYGRGETEDSPGAESHERRDP
jgi:hypothetical protein